MLRHRGYDSLIAFSTTAPRAVASEARLQSSRRQRGESFAEQDGLEIV
jgi:hypothetical protein